MILSHIRSNLIIHHTLDCVVSKPIKGQVLRDIPSQAFLEGVGSGHVKNAYLSLICIVGKTIKSVEKGDK